MNEVVGLEDIQIWEDNFLIHFMKLAKNNGCSMWEII